MHLLRKQVAIVLKLYLYLQKILVLTLKNNNYIMDLSDINGNGCNGYVQITTVDKISHYKGHIICQDYQTRNY